MAGGMRAAILLLALWGCADETVSGYAETDATWRLAELDGTPFPARATLRFPEEGAVAGDAPCNAFRGPQTVPYPWIAIGPLAATRRACPDMASETAYLAALEAMTLAEVAGDVLILTDDAGREMVFRRE